MDLHNEKANLRSNIRTILSVMDVQERSMASKSIINHIIQNPLFINCNAMFAYMPLNTEVDTKLLIDIALAQGKRVALPRCKKDGSLDFHWIESQYINSLKKGPYALYEPSVDLPLAIPIPERTIILVPAFAYTPLGIRVGKGKGYYDRFLATLEPGPLTVGLCFEKQLLHEIPSDTHDMVVNAVVTENGWAATGI